MKINKNLVALKIHYFLFFAAISPVAPFMPVYIRQLGVSQAGAGVIFAVMPIAGMIGKPLYGALSDHFRRKKLLFLMISIVIGGLCFFSVILLPKLPHASNANLQCIPGEDHPLQLSTCHLSGNCAVPEKVVNISDDVKSICKISCSDVAVWSNWTEPTHFTGTISLSDVNMVGKCLILPLGAIPHEEQDNQDFDMCNNSLTTVFLLNSTINCDVRCDNPYVAQMLESPMTDKTVLYSSVEFWLFCGAFLFTWLNLMASISMGDAICYQILGDRRLHFGRQRLFGTIGWGLFSFLGGLVVTQASSGRLRKDYTHNFYLMIGIFVLDLIVASRMKVPERPIPPITPSLTAAPPVRLRHLLVRPSVLLFIVWCTFMGTFLGLQWQFHFWYLEDLADWEGCEGAAYIKLLQGIVLIMQCLFGEIPAYFISGWVLGRLGHQKVMSLVMLLVGIRFILYSLITNPWYTLAIELLHGPVMGFTIAAMTSMACVLAPPGSEATLQGLAGALLEGLGVGIGGLCGGLMYQSLGGAKTFQIFGICSAFSSVLHAIAHYQISKKQNSKVLKQDEGPAEEMVSLKGMEHQNGQIESKAQNNEKKNVDV